MKNSTNSNPMSLYPTEDAMTLLTAQEVANMLMVGKNRVYELLKQKFLAVYVVDNVLHTVAQMHLLSKRAVTLLKHHGQSQFFHRLCYKFGVVAIVVCKGCDNCVRLFYHTVKGKIGFCLVVAKGNTFCTVENLVAPCFQCLRKVCVLVPKKHKVCPVVAKNHFLISSDIKGDTHIFCSLYKVVV